MMADGGGGGGGGDDDVFVYTGGEQEAPRMVRHIIIDRSVKIIPARAFRYRTPVVCGDA